MARTIKVKATDGSVVEFVDEMIGQGAMKDVYFSPDKSYVVAFFREKQDANTRDRLENITGVYRERIFNQPGGDYWRGLFSWPEKVVEWEGKLGIVVPTYPKHFMFEGGKFKGKEKIAKWFASAKLRNKFVEREYKGDWFKHVQLLISLTRAVKRLHAAGLAHSDLSYNNILVDPNTGRACIIDCDGLVVPGKYPPDVVGTPDFIAPEVLETRSLRTGDPNKKLPSILTDRHALAVFIYELLLYRHPLRGGKVHDMDAAKDEELMMGKNALFIEHPTDKSNRPKIDQLNPSELPQGDITKLPYTICGPYLKELFDRAFIDGLHNPALRPTADEWLTALVKTADLMQPCSNPNCQAGWFVFDNRTRPVCPHCHQPYVGVLPVLNLYYKPRAGAGYILDNHKIMVFDKQSLYPWHVNRFIFPNEKMTAQEKRPVGDFHFSQGQWILINRALPDMIDVSAPGGPKPVPIGQCVPLTEGRQILLGKKDGDRLLQVQLSNK